MNCVIVFGWFGWREGKLVFEIKVCKNEIIDVVFCCFKCFIVKDGVLVEVKKCKYYEKLSVKCKKKFEVVCKRKFQEDLNNMNFSE